MAPERGRIDLRSDDDVERMLDWLTARTQYSRPRALRLALWAICSRLGMPDLPPLSRLLSVRPGRPKVSRNGPAPTPPAAPGEEPAR